MRPRIDYCAAEHSYLVRCGRHTLSKLGPWPDLASSVLHGNARDWRPSRAAAERVMAAISTQHPALPWTTWSALRRSGHLPPYARRPHLTRLPDGDWVERATRQRLLPWADGRDHEHERELVLHYDAARDYQALIPGAVRTFSKRFRSGHIPLLRLLSAVPESEELAATHPALFFLLAHRLNRPAASWIRRDDAQMLLRRPLPELLAACTGLPPSRASVTVLRYLPPAQVSVEAATHLARAVHQPGFGRCLTHFRAFPWTLLEVLTKPSLWPVLTPPLLHAFAHPSREADLWERLADLELAARRVQRLAGKAEGPGLHRFTSLEDVRDFLAVFAPPRAPALDSAPSPWPDDTPLPPPPFPGDADVVPLRTVGEMRAEGHLRRNCIGEDWQIGRVLGGECHAYRMHHPTRATLMLQRVDSDPAAVHPWVIEDLRGDDDAPTTLATVRHAVRILGVPARLTPTEGGT